MSRPARKREAKRSAARVSVTRSAPEATTRIGVSIARGKIGILERAHQAKGGVQPADRRPAERRVRRSAATTPACARSARGPRSATLPAKGSSATIFEPPPGAKAPPRPSASSASARAAQRAGARSRRARSSARSGPAARTGSGPPARRRAGSPRPWNGTRPNHGRGHDGSRTSSDERVEIALVKREIVDMALARVAQLARRSALAAPVHRRDGEAAIEQIAGSSRNISR